MSKKQTNKPTKTKPAASPSSSKADAARGVTICVAKELGSLACNCPACTEGRRCPGGF